MAKKQENSFFKNSVNNVKNVLSPKVVKQGSYQLSNQRIFNHRDYSKRVTTYKVVTYTPKNNVKIDISKA